jgi:DNA-binding response OmpR family regulator
MKLLILDDDTNLLEALKRVLQLHKMEVDTSSRASEAVEMVEKGAYDFVLVDYKMPENDGIWFMENAKIPRETRVLLITAYVNRDVINRMFALGASGYLIKPFDEDELLRNLEFFSRGDT